LTAANQFSTTSLNAPISIDLTAQYLGTYPTGAALVGTPVGGTVAGFPGTTVVFTPTAGFSGAASFQFALNSPGVTSNTATAGITVSCSAAAAAALTPTGGQCSPPPHIYFGGVDVTGTTTTVAAGQPINVTAQPAGTGVSHPWSVLDSTGADAKIIGGYTPTSSNFQSGVTTKPTGTNNSANFYFYIPGQYTITYTYLQKNGQETASTAAFSVSPLPIPSVQVTYGTPNENWIYSPNPNQLEMGFGNASSGLKGITFSTPTDSGNGSYIWVQILQLDRVNYYSNGVLTSTCKSTTGLDAGKPAQYPYDKGPETWDIPGVGLFSTNDKVTRSFAAQMYLEWISNEGYSIPVPLGSVTWGFSESSHLDPNALLGWSTPLVRQHPTFFIAGVQYPLWRELASGDCGLL
jgi:hypothetical protein